MLSIDEMVIKLTEANENLRKAMKQASATREKMAPPDKRGRRAQDAHNDLQESLMSAQLLADDLKLICKFRMNRDHRQLDQPMYEAVTVSLAEVLQDLSETSKMAKVHI